MVDPFKAFVHRCMQMQSLVTQSQQVACGSGNILIEGEPGTGKKLLARAIHAASPLCDKPFVVINCASIPEILLEPELFGYERGGFTLAAHKTFPGQLERASGGTVFLDEVSELPLPVQSKLLETLDTRTVTPIGGRKRRSVDVRIISASTRRLDLSVGMGGFNRVLRHRMADHFLWIPPLRERSGDVEVLVDYLLSTLPARFAPEGCKVLAPGGLDRLVAHSWPGNVSELKHVLEWAFARASDRPKIEMADLNLSSGRR